MEQVGWKKNEASCCCQVQIEPYSHGTTLTKPGNESSSTTLYILERRMLLLLLLLLWKCLGLITFIMPIVLIILMKYVRKNLTQVHDERVYAQDSTIHCVSTKPYYTVFEICSADDIRMERLSHSVW